MRAVLKTDSFILFILLYSKKETWKKDISQSLPKVIVVVVCMCKKNQRFKHVWGQVILIHTPAFYKLRLERENGCQRNYREWIMYNSKCGQIYLHRQLQDQKRNKYIQHQNTNWSWKKTGKRKSQLFEINFLQWTWSWLWGQLKLRPLAQIYYFKLTLRNGNSKEKT